jgi:hypothetical protein
MDDRVARIVGLAGQADLGLLEGLRCPDCGTLAVEVWFSHPAENEYRVWFLCSTCNFQTRAQVAEKPTFYSEERLRQDLEARDEAIRDSTIFKNPRDK